MADMLTTERFMLKFRLLAVLAVVLAFFAAGRGEDPTRVVVLSLLYLVFAFGLPTVLARWPRADAIYPIIVADGVFLGLLLPSSGSAASLIVILFPLTVAFYAAYGAYRTALFAAAANLAVLSVVQVYTGRPLANVAFLAQVPLFFLLALLTGYLAQGRLRRLEEQESLQRLLRLENSAQSLSGAVRTIQEASDIGSVLQDMAEAAPGLTGLPQCLIGILDRKSGALVARASTSNPETLSVERIEDICEWPGEGSLLSTVLATRQPVAVRSAQASGQHAPLPAWFGRLQPGALLAVPLSSRGVDVGIAFFYGVPAGHPFSAQEVARTQAFADVVAPVAVNAQLYEDAQVTVASVLNDLHPVVLPKANGRGRLLPVMEVGDMVVDIPGRQAKICGRTVGLTPTEFDLLSVLAENSGHAVDQDALLRRVWGDDYRGRSTVVDVGVHRLRRKIEAGAGAPRRIVTVRGSGYMLLPVTALARSGEGR